MARAEILDYDSFKKMEYEHFKKMKTDTVEKNGYTIKSWYQGMETYWAFKGEQEVFFGWCLDQLIDAIGFNPYGE